MKKNIVAFLLSSVPFAFVLCQTPHNKKDSKIASTESASSATPTINKKGAETTFSLFKNLKDSASYALGLNIAKNLKSQNMDDISIDLLARGLEDVFNEKKIILPDQIANECIGNFKHKEQAQLLATLYKCDRWLDFKTKGFDNAYKNPTYENVEILQTNKMFKVTLGSKILNYKIVASKRFSDVQMRYDVILDGKSFVIAVSKHDEGLYSIGIEDKDIWMVYPITDVSTTKIK